MNGSSINHAEVQLAPSELTPNPLNPRGPVGAEDPGMDGLIESVREKGVLQPLIVLSDGTIVIGHRRHKAAEIAELATVPCILRDYDPIEQQEIMLVENLQRQDLDPLREGQAYARLVSAGVGQHDIARRCGVYASRVSDRLQVAAFPEDIGRLFATLELPVSAARVLAKIEGEDELRRIVGMVVARRLAVPKIEKLVKETTTVKKPPRNYEIKKQSERPQGIVRNELVAALTARAGESITIGDMVSELEYVCCACGLGATEKGRATLCSACPLTSFLNRFAHLPLKEGTPVWDLMAKTATEAGK